MGWGVDDLVTLSKKCCLPYCFMSKREFENAKGGVIFICSCPRFKSQQCPVIVTLSLL